MSWPNTWARKKKKEFYAPHDNLAAAAALHFVFPPAALVYISRFSFSALLLCFFFFVFLGEWKWKTATNICTKRKMLLAYRCKFYMHTLHLCRECVEICYFKCWRPKGCTPGWILLAGSGGAKGSSVARWEVWQSGPRAAKVLQNHSTKEFNQQCLAGRQPYQHTHTHARTQPHQSAVKLRLTGEA